MLMQSKIKKLNKYRNKRLSPFVINSISISVIVLFGG
jgi:hypothetical protein